MTQKQKDIGLLGFGLGILALVGLALVGMVVFGVMSLVGFLRTRVFRRPPMCGCFLDSPYCVSCWGF